eukprot:gnl/Chilomastix_cuspidata/2898.p1 GENE.gnl/Chilomastix_cuspidata/2898~~gnl/Chilomastix_cuspidata/2898.p1  ORF type:complete len:279 (-),score=55.45 gnl/Chilomastix_cuspidata/2898:8-844(-)
MSLFPNLVCFKYTSEEPFITGLSYPQYDIGSLHIRRPVLVISDLHLGVGDKRDPFSRGEPMSKTEFLVSLPSFEFDLVLNGDILDMWRCPKALGDMIDEYSIFLHDLRERAHTVVYLRGNHDAGIPSGALARFGIPILDALRVHGRDGAHILVMHGHQNDPIIKACGFAAKTGIAKGAKGEHPESGADLFHMGRRSALVSLSRTLRARFAPLGCVGVVFGHTHEPWPIVETEGNEGWIRANSANCLSGLRYLVMSSGVGGRVEVRVMPDAALARPGSN